MPQPNDRTPPPRPRPAHDGAPLTEADMGRALRKLRQWTGLGLVTLADKHEDLSKSTIAHHERDGRPTEKFLDALIPTCLDHHGGFTPQEILDELTFWHDARDNLRRGEQALPAPAPQPDPHPAPATSDDTEQVATAEQAASKVTNDTDSPDPAPEGMLRRWADVSNLWVIGGAAAAIMGAVVAVGITGLLGPHEPDSASAADRQLPQSAARATQPLVDSPPYIAGATYRETVNSSAEARTFSDPYGMVGPGQRIPNHIVVHVSCKVVAPTPGATTVGTYWYRITDPPWNNYYSPTNSFLNDDPISGSHTKAVDEKVPYCPP